MRNLYLTWPRVAQLTPYLPEAVCLFFRRLGIHRPVVMLRAYRKSVYITSSTRFYPKNVHQGMRVVCERRCVSAQRESRCFYTLLPKERSPGAM